jgi:phage tail tape-measure protein
MAAGAAAGSVVPGIGTVIGGAVGLASGIFSDTEKRKQRKADEKASRPERRRMTSILENLNRYKQQQLAAKTSAAAAGFDFASQLRF